MNLLTGLFRAARKRLMTVDNDMGMFRDKLNELVAGKDSLSEEDIATKVEELKGFTKDLPGDEDKAKLDRFLEDFKSVKEQDGEAAKEAAGMVADLFEKLDTEAMKDVPSAEPEATVETEEAVEETVAPEGDPAEDGALEEGLESAKEPVSEEPAEDADPNTAYTLEEIYQFIKKRMAEEGSGAEDGCAKDSADEVEEEEEKEEEEVVTDHAPFIPVTIGNKKAASGSLGSMFAQIKNGGR